MDAGKITVKLVLDTTEFYPALERVKEALANLHEVAAKSVSAEVFDPVKFGEQINRALRDGRQKGAH